MAPERLGGGGASGYPSDIWSFGLLAFEGVLGAYPYHSESRTHFELVSAIVHGPPPPSRPELKFRGVSPDLWALLHVTLAKDPLERPDALRVLGSPAMQRLHRDPIGLAAWLRELMGNSRSGSGSSAPGNNTPPPPISPDL